MLHLTDQIAGLMCHRFEPVADEPHALTPALFVQPHTQPEVLWLEYRLNFDLMLFLFQSQQVTVLHRPRCLDGPRQGFALTASSERLQLLFVFGHPPRPVRRETYTAASSPDPTYLADQ